MSRTLHTYVLAIKLCAEEEKRNKRSKMMDACCDADLQKDRNQFFWDITNGRAPLQSNKVQQYKRLKAW